MEITRHAYARSGERLGFNRGATKRISLKAFDSGLRISETTGALNRYLTHLWHKEHTANEIRVFAEKVWIFSTTKLITVFSLPLEYRRAANKIKRRKDKP